MAELKPKDFTPMWVPADPEPADLSITAPAPPIFTYKVPEINLSVEEFPFDEGCNCPECQQAKQQVNGGKLKKELCFVMYKPDAFERALVGELMSIVDSKGLKMIGAKTFVMTQQQVEQHYSHHIGKDFWKDMIDFYTGGTTLAVVYKGHNANNAIRQLIGNKHPSESPPGSIRGKYATSFPRNLIHGSDSEADALVEMERFFTQKEISEFKKNKNDC